MHATTGRSPTIGEDEKRYSDEEVALILHKVTDLAKRSDIGADYPSGLTLREIKAVGAEVGIDPVLIDRAARLLPPRRQESFVERLIGGPIKHRIETHLATKLTEERSTHVLSAVRAHVDGRGQGQADASGMSWSAEAGRDRTSVTAHAEGDDTRVRIAVDRRAALGFLVFVTQFVIVMSVWIGSGSVDSYLDALAFFGIPLVGGLAIARSLWASSTRAMRERASALLDTVCQSLTESGADSGEPSAGRDETERVTPPVNEPGERAQPS